MTDEQLDDLAAAIASAIAAADAVLAKCTPNPTNTMTPTNHRATITQIEHPHPGAVTLVKLNLPDRYYTDDFNLRPLGDIGATGGTDRTGWVALHGDCLLKVGDTLTLKA